MNKKIILILMLSIFLISIIAAQVSYCCERLQDNGPYCQNAPEEECDPDYLSVPTSCEATSYCRLGTCIDNVNGFCMPNTPQRVCENGENPGVWDEREEKDIPQCQLGCCLIGEQAAFSTLTRCKSLASFYGLEINYRTDVQSEIQCIALASPKVKGACVFEEEYQTNCKMITKAECQELNTGENTANFYEGYLCSAESLGTICGPSEQTTCVEGKDKVYYLDTCGNLANIYDADYSPSPTNLNRPGDYQDFWSKIRTSTCTLDLNAGAGDDSSPERCGDCDYFAGSTCKNSERGNNPAYGNYICKDLGCEDEDFEREYGRNPEHGETWCARTIGDNIQLGANPGLSGDEIDEIDKEGNNPGNRDFRLVCYNNEISVEPCADYRQEVCIESSIGEVPAGGFKTAACTVNMWQDCYSQTNERDCTNIDKRDCRWIKGVSILKDEDDKGLVLNTDGELVSASDDEDFETEDGNLVEASCIPKYAPGFDFWEEGTDAGDNCGKASTVCYVEYSAYATEIGGTAGGGLWGEKGKPLDAKCMDNCRAECPIDDPLNICNRNCEEQCPSQCVEYDEDYEIKDSWKEDMNNVCMAMGDCGSSVNYINEPGYYDRDKDFVSRSSDEEEE